MLRELLGFCLPLILHTPHVDPHALQSRDEASYGWSARAVKAWENIYLLCRNQTVGGIYGGKVIGLTDETITVQLGKRIPRTFSLAVPLLSDRIPLNYGPGMGYRLRDVQLGDKVDLDVVSVRDGFVCLAIGIGRRPGGIIPPGEDPPAIPENCRRHHFYNAAQFTEEKVVPALSRQAMRLIR
jgi:hypothetical protein